MLIYYFFRYCSRQVQVTSVRRVFEIHAIVFSNLLCVKVNYTDVSQQNMRV